MGCLGDELAACRRVLACLLCCCRRRPALPLSPCGDPLDAGHPAADWPAGAAPPVRPWRAGRLRGGGWCSWRWARASRCPASPPPWRTSTRTAAAGCPPTWCRCGAAATGRRWLRQRAPPSRPACQPARASLLTGPPGACLPCPALPLVPCPAARRRSATSSAPTPTSAPTARRAGSTQVGGCVGGAAAGSWRTACSSGCLPCAAPSRVCAVRLPEPSAPLRGPSSVLSSRSVGPHLWVLRLHHHQLLQPVSRARVSRGPGPGVPALAPPPALPSMHRGLGEPRREGCKRTSRPHQLCPCVLSIAHLHAIAVQGACHAALSLSCPCRRHFVWPRKSVPGTTPPSSVAVLPLCSLTPHLFSCHVCCCSALPAPGAGIFSPPQLRSPAREYELPGFRMQITWL